MASSSVAEGARHIQDDSLGLALGVFLNGAMRMEELAGDVGENSSATGETPPLVQSEEAGQELAKVAGGREFRGLRGEPPHCCNDLKRKELRIGQFVND